MMPPRDRNETRKTPPGRNRENRSSVTSTKGGSYARQLLKDRLCRRPGPGPPPSGSDFRFAGARAPAITRRPWVAAPCHPDPGRPPHSRRNPARRPPPRPPKPSAHRLTRALARPEPVPGNPPDPDPPRRRTGQKNAAVTKHAPPRDEDARRTTGQPGVRRPLSQPRPSGTRPICAAPRTARHGRRTSESELSALSGCIHTGASPVGAENRVTLCDLDVFADQAAEPVPVPLEYRFDRRPAGYPCVRRRACTR